MVLLLDCKVRFFVFLVIRGINVIFILSILIDNSMIFVFYFINYIFKGKVVIIDLKFVN